MYYQEYYVEFSIYPEFDYENKIQRERLIFNRKVEEFEIREKLEDMGFNVEHILSFLEGSNI